MPSSWIPNAELNAQRDAAELTFPDTCIINRLAEVSDGQGGMTQSWTAAGTVDARIVAKSGKDRATSAQVQETGDYVLTVPHDTDIVATDIAVINSQRYRVLFVDDTRITRTAIRCDVMMELG